MVSPISGALIVVPGWPMAPVVYHTNRARTEYLPDTQVSAVVVNTCEMSCSITRVKGSTVSPDRDLGYDGCIAVVELDPDCLNFQGNSGGAPNASQANSKVPGDCLLARPGELVLVVHGLKVLTEHKPQEWMNPMCLACFF